MAEHLQSASWQIGEWIADPSDDSLSRQGTSIKIEPRMMHLLICLAESAPHVVSIERLLAEVWSGVIVGSASVYQSISQLRKTLGDTEPTPRYIETVARKGYRLVASVSRLAAEPTTAADVGTPQSPVRRRARLLLMAGACGAAALLAGAVALWQVRGSAQPQTDSIVVLPFVDLTAEQVDRPFCDGLTEELSSWLAQLPSLNVVARTSAFAFRDKGVDVREIGRQLGTTHVLEGSVRREGDALRITVKLVATGSGYQLWSESYDTALSDVLSVQEQIARAVAANLEVRLTQNTVRRFDARRTTKDHAYRLYLVARHHQQQRTRADNEQAIELYKTVLREDGTFALAHVGLAIAYLNQRYFVDRPIAAIAADVEPLLAAAQRLQPDLADLYVARGALETEQLKPTAALRDLRRAVQLNPNSRDAFAELGFLHLTSGDPRDALTNYTRAAMLDPIDGNLHAQRCMALQDLARFEEAALACERARALDPRSTWSFSASSWLADARGRLDEALQWNEAALARSPDVADNFAQRGIWLLMLGLPQRAVETYQKAMSSLPRDSGPNAQLLELGFLIAYESGGVSALRTQIGATRLDATTPPQTLFEVAQAALLANDVQLARELVDRALADRSLDRAMLNSPWLARTGESYQLTAALAKQLTHDAAGAEQHLAEVAELLDRMTAGGMRRYGVEELRAQVAALRGNAGDAMRYLQAAADLGWPGAWRVKHEPYFASLRSRTDYRKLTERLERANERMRRQLAANSARAPEALPSNAGVD